MEQFADIILKSNCIFTAKDQEVIDGYVAIKGNRIIAVEKGEIPNEMIGKVSKVICLKDKTVSPGFVDVHCFFTGYVVRFLGCDLSVCQDKETVFKQLDKYLETSPKNYPLLAFSLSLHQGMHPNNPQEKLFYHIRQNVFQRHPSKIVCREYRL